MVSSENTHSALEDSLK